ncbi:MAG: DNA primase, partial [Acidimicrobiales bacterium]
MGIVDEDIGRVREASDIVAIISQYTQLRRVGRRFQGLCPFHAEKSPSFSVNAEEGLYYCFGCGVRGDAITFVREKEHLDFVGSVEWLAGKAGITLNYTDAGGGEDRRRKTKLQEAIAGAVAWYHDRLLTGGDAGAARSYLRQRGFDGATVRKFQVGWAPDGWDTLARSLRLSNADLTDSGLGFVNRRGRQQDAFRNRILFPVFDAQGTAVGFGGRVLPGGDGPKYKNSSESTVYAKSRLLYGLNWAKTEIVEADEVVVCEGYTDVIGFASAGLGRAVATCGTALTEEHVKLLRRFARRVVLAFDADAAGQNAAARFYEWERAHDLDVAVADLPAG